MADTTFQDTIAAMADEFNAANEAAERLAASFKAAGEEYPTPGRSDASQPAASHPNEEEAVVDAAKGAICDVKDLYQSQKSTCSCCTERVEVNPFKEKKTAEKAENKFAAFALAHPDDDDGVQELAEHPLNGRQIKSAIKTAAVLANSQGSPVMLRHLRVVLNLWAKAVKSLKRDSTPPSFKLVKPGGDEA
ncbi:uncharacterized protein THITE_2086378 [Thermothielavioides terrestris NRRL 8126]|uniref:Uncharacterized protein n=1 Tax=Thermothielavioides terrestris (strain ATCC 38088 / NRRL 8126) TaxID=578455 RepID=G2R1F4_THETT|nr:uncharacterized protein THITE_2086378 [Thermothielavioides terrestris NRRL 8126]AEO64889.1 hypothetical protein THITE_2086378 [Thermothielavioides terrestris NRRL 8126]